MDGADHNRFDTFLKFSMLKQSKENLKKFCKKVSKFKWRFTKKDYLIACKKYNIIPSNPYCKKKIKKQCSANGCTNVEYLTRMLCSKHYQREMAKKRGYWRSGNGRMSKYYG